MTAGKKVLAVDFGYSSIKVAYENETGVLTLDKFVSAVAKIPDPLEVIDDKGSSVFPFMGSFYVIGGDALRVPRSYLLGMEDFDGLKEVYPVVLSYIMNKYGGPEKWDHIAIGLSLSFTDKADDLLDRLQKTLLIDKANFFLCLPQGMSARLTYSDYGLNLVDSTKWNNAKMKNYLIVDGGFLTIDAVLCVDGKSAAGSSLGLVNTGTICISRDLQNYMASEYDITLSLREAATVVDTRGEFNRRGRSYDLKEIVDKFSRKYIENILNLLENRFSEDLDGCQGVVICGGLGYLFDRYLDEDDEEVIKIIESHFPRTFLTPIPKDGESEFYNVVSYLKIVE